MSTRQPTTRNTTPRQLQYLAVAMAATFLIAASLHAQTPQPRLASEIDASQYAVIPGTHPPKAIPAFDAGRVPSSTPMPGVTMVFTRSAAQEADLQSVIAAQQDPSSPQYHRWLNPDEFAARFGLADADISKVAFWLQQQGFSIDATSRGKNRLTFSGTAAQVEAAFATEMHYYVVNGEKHFAPSTDISVPAALAPLVQTVSNLSTFRPKPHVKLPISQPTPYPHFTSSQSGEHFLTPKDVATIYDIAPAYSSGLTGSGQSIAIVGQSSIAVTDIENFETAAGLTKKDPTLVLVPNSGTPTISSGDEMESDIDLEYSTGTAPGATIYFVYVGNSNNYSVFNSLEYAIDQRTAPIISISYGDCESDLGSGEYSGINGSLEEAASQGQSVVTADGDAGSTDCSGNTRQTLQQQEALAVDFPSSSQYVTAMGGSEFPTADIASTNTTYWEPANGSDVIGSARSYIPEMVWNDDFPPVGKTAGGLSSGGGGVSTLTPRPTWQTGVPGIPAGNFRLVPDISLTASPNNAGFLYCSSDSMTNITGSCSHGFRDTNDTDLTVAGGTSFDAPIFAGMLALLNQKLNSTGQGVVNTTLYKIASNSTTYASAFHDITTGNNECTAAGSTLCSAAGESAYVATAGYDLASGLGSVDFNNLLSAITNSSATKSFTLAAASATVAAGNSTTSAITVTPQNGYTGSIAFTVTPAIANACFVLPSLTVSGASAVAATLTIYTSSTACASIASDFRPDKQLLAAAPSLILPEPLSHFPSQSSIWPLSAPPLAVPTRTFACVTLASLFLIAILTFRNPRRAALCSAFVLTALVLTMSGCGGGSSSSPPPTGADAAKGTYTLTVVGTDTTTQSVTASTTLTLTID